VQMRMVARTREQIRFIYIAARVLGKNMIAR